MGKIKQVAIAGDEVISLLADLDMTQSSAEDRSLGWRLIDVIDDLTDAEYDVLVGYLAERWVSGTFALEGLSRWAPSLKGDIEAELGSTGDSLDEPGESVTEYRNGGSVEFLGVEVEWRDPAVWTIDSAGGAGAINSPYAAVLAAAMEDMDDAVQHPSHYTESPAGVECIDIVRHMNFCLGSAVKYIWRCGSKGDAYEDLRKAIQFLEFEIDRIEATDDKVSAWV